MPDEEPPQVGKWCYIYHLGVGLLFLMATVYFIAEELT